MMASSHWREEFPTLFKWLVSKHAESTFKDEILNIDVSLKMDEIGEGDLNEVFCVYEEADRTKSVVIKHSPPYLKVLGPSFPLSCQRLEVEYNALKMFSSLAPGLVPVPYFFDADHSIACMEDLRGYRDLRKELIDGNFHPDIARQLATFLAAIHSHTHVNNVNIQGKDELWRKFQNKAMVSLNEQYLFTKPFNLDDETNQFSEIIKPHLPVIYEDPEVLSTVNEMRKLYLEKKECLLHGDLHSGSIMVQGSSPKVIDTEFACIGPGAFDMALLIAHYVISYYCHMSIQENNDCHRAFAQKMIEACKTTAKTYFQSFTVFTGSRASAHEEEFMSEAAGFAGCELVTRIIGVTHAEDFNAPGVDVHAEEDAFHAGVRLLKGYKKIHSIDRLLTVALMLA